MRQTILDELRKELLNRGSFDDLPASVWKGISSLNTYGTNAIEGNTLTQADVETVIIDQKGVERPINDILETVQHEAAFRNLINRKKRAIDMVSILEIHEEVFRGLMVDAGQYRRTNVLIRGADFTPPRPEKIIVLMEAMVKEYDQRDLTGESVFSLGSWMHHGFESMHPFSNGNGRVGRLLMNLHFLKHNWPPVHVLPADREGYLGALREGNKGDLIPLTEYLMVIMGSSIIGLLSEVGTSQDELKPLEQLQKENAYSAKYLSLRARQGELPAVRIKSKWQTSERALDVYIKEVGRKA